MRVCGKQLVLRASGWVMSHIQVKLPQLTHSSQKHLLRWPANVLSIFMTSMYTYADVQWSHRGKAPCPTCRTPEVPSSWFPHPTIQLDDPHHNHPQTAPRYHQPVPLTPQYSSQWGRERESFSVYREIYSETVTSFWIITIWFNDNLYLGLHLPTWWLSAHSEVLYSQTHPK